METVTFPHHPREATSHCIEAQEYDMGEYEQYAQWMRHNSTVIELEAATSQIAAVSITSQGELEVVTSPNEEVTDHDKIAPAPAPAVKMYSPMDIVESVKARMANLRVRQTLLHEEVVDHDKIAPAPKVPTQV